MTLNVLDNTQEVVQPVTTETGPVIDPNDPTCRILTNVALNYRSGPSTDFDRLGTFSAGQQVPIVGRLGDNSWWQVQASSFTVAWVSSDFTTEYGNCIGIPIVASPPTPTSTAATATPTNTPTPIPTSTSEPTNTPLPSSTPRPADLIVSNITGNDELVLDGGSVEERFTATITNSGGQTTGPFTVTARFLPGGDVVEMGTVSSLDAGASILLSADLTFEAVGEFTVQITADSEDTVEELSDVNNVGSYPVFVTAE
ncbi:MAG: CARDB domain-containing protein [Chloroflexota bacterium]